MAIEPNPDVVHRRLGDRTVLIQMQTNEIYEFNQTLSRFWELLGTHRDRVEVERRLTEEFDVDPATLAREVDELVLALEAKRMIVRS